VAKRAGQPSGPATRPAWPKPPGPRKDRKVVHALLTQFRAIVLGNNARIDLHVSPQRIEGNATVWPERDQIRLGKDERLRGKSAMRCARRCQMLRTRLRRLASSRSGRRGVCAAVFDLHSTMHWLLRRVFYCPSCIVSYLALTIALYPSQCPAVLSI